MDSTRFVLTQSGTRIYLQGKHYILLPTEDEATEYLEDHELDDAFNNTNNMSHQLLCDN